MNIYLLKDIVLLGALILANSAGWWRYPQLDKASRGFVRFLGLSLFTEALAVFCARQYHDNRPVYNILNPLLFSALWYFFYQALFVFKYTITGWVLLVAGWLFYIGNTLFFQHITELGTNFLQMEGLAIISMVLLYFYDRVHSIGYKPFDHLLPFWFCIGLLLLWCGTFFIWAFLQVIPHMTHGDAYNQQVLYNILFLINITFYCYNTLVLILKPSEKNRDAQR